MFREHEKQIYVIVKIKSKVLHYYRAFTIFNKYCQPGGIEMTIYIQSLDQCPLIFN